MAKKYYAVRNGRKNGIYKTWKECQQQINNFSQAEFKGFNNKNDALNFLNKNKAHQIQKKQNNKNFDLIVYTDGGSRNHGNKKGEHVKKNDPAAWAIKLYGILNLTKSGGHLGATNNQMELAAFYTALNTINQEKLSNKKIKFVLDSKYVLDGINKYLENWKTRNFVNVKNKQFWMAIDQELKKLTNYKTEWTKGHAKNEGNNEVDKLLNQYMDQYQK